MTGVTLLHTFWNNRLADAFDSCELGLEHEAVFSVPDGWMCCTEDDFDRFRMLRVGKLVVSVFTLLTGFRLCKGLPLQGFFQLVEGKLVAVTFLDRFCEPSWSFV